MKRIITTFALFAALSIVFSNLTGCRDVSEMERADNAVPAPNSNTVSADKKSSEFPPLAAGLAETQFTLLDGTKFKVSDKKGKVLLLNIWGTWCGPCRAEMPTLIALQDQYRDQGFEVIGLNIGDGNGGPEPLDDITKFVAKMKLNYTVAISSQESTAEFYKVTKQGVVPQSLMIDREGRLRGVFIGGGERVYAQMRDTLAKTIVD